MESTTKKKSIPVLSFTYFKVDQFKSLDDILSSSDENIESLYKNYTLVGDENYPDYNLCPIYDVLYSDIVNCDLDGIKNMYNGYVDKYGQSKVNKIIIRESKFVEKKIYDIILFAINNVYKTDKIALSFYRMPSVGRYRSSIPDIIYYIATKHFTITSQRVTGSNMKYCTLIISTILPDYKIQRIERKEEII